MTVVTNRPFRVSRKADLAEGIFGLWLEPADGQPVFPFRPGQFVMLHLLLPDGSTWAKAAYSIASAPSESHGAIELAVKLRRDFTHRLNELEPGSMVNVQGPFGRFCFPEGAGPVIILAGGVGITPFRGMIREELHEGTGRRIALVYSCKSVESMPYLEEFRALAADHPNFTALLSLTAYAPEDWTGETGRIKSETLDKLGMDVDDADFLVCGSPEFVKDMAEMLAKRGVDVKLRLHKEMF